MVLVLDDHPIARQGLESVIKLHRPDEETVQAGTVKEAIDLTKEKSIDSVFVDLNLHNESGFDFLEWIQSQNKNIKTFVITSSSSESDFVKAKNMGIDAYILKDAFIDDIMYSLRVVDRGGKFYSSDLMANVGNTSEDDKRIDTLTRRELEVALLLREGYSNAKIANNLSISEGTVKKHISNIFSKLEIYNRTEVLVFVEKHMERFQTILNS
ncbi:MAG: response regulator transcription factor [Lachnospiraceae bacterium]|jgi:nitrate/nitrite response regulator protein|nr:response regulator transcription factor [uncultured Lachnoanaerobaculum sp.]MBF1009692.1 response regulator transcription factor [Lachnoanaerobaculum sp.]MBS6729874.1 response regulator transcription factor [Lachnospiraceae bacterium oral taxon 082]MBS6930347.1 response regulator transcription factor [Lachnospiraceae bacterium oral taxon 082]MDU5598509.1 response regulator transcription factor [Lachnospiraceae bacterium]